MTDSRAHDKMTRLGLGYRTGTQAFAKALTDTPKQASQKRMITYLHDEAEGLTAWEREFVESLHRRAQDPNFFHLTDKQDEVLSNLFERY